MAHKQPRKGGTPRSGPSTARSRLSCLLSASLLLTLCACSTVPSTPPEPRLQANLQQKCPPPPKRPTPFVDPERLAWENRIIAQYGDCGLRHILTVEAWPTDDEKK